MFEWLDRDIAEVKTNKYFVVEGPPAPEVVKAIQTEALGLPASYKAFVLKYGTAKLYRQHVGYGLGVLGTPLPAEAPSGEQLLRIGHFQERPVYFKTSDVGGGKEVPVFESGAGGFVQAAASFEDWLQARAAAIRKKLGKRGWQTIVKGPPPFTAKEKALVAARNDFEWKVLGVADNGDIRIEVANESDVRLPFLSIGVRNTDGTFQGALWLPTSDLAPGERRVFEREAYKKLIPRDQLELYALPDPGPEDRDAYWEFRKPPA